MNDFVSQIIALSIGVLSALGMYFSIVNIITSQKLEKRRKEWLEIKSGIPIEIIISKENGFVKAELSTDKQHEAYIKYCETLMNCERNPFTGACFPPFGLIENDKTISTNEQDIPEDEAVKHLIGILWEEIGNQNFVIIDKREGAG